MAVQRNQFINDVDLSASTSLTHLLDSTDDSDDITMIKHSPYYCEGDFGKLLTDRAGFSILSVNIQSINAKLDEFQAFISRVNIVNPISIVCLQECWLSEKDDINMLNLENYELIHQTNQCCAHGGLIIYVHKQFKCKHLNNINLQSTDWEYLCVEVSHRKPHSKKYIICNVYRKPGVILNEFEQFVQEFELFMVNIKNLKHSSYLCGDYNIDLLRINTDRHFCQYFNNIIANGFLPLITLPTRISDRSSTLIDNIFTNDIEELGQSGILLTHLSDHQMVFTYIEKLDYIEKIPKFIDIETKDERSIKNFIEELENLNINDQLKPLTDSNPNDNYEIFAQLLKYAKDKHLPKRTVKYKKHKHKKCKWMTNVILNSINIKNKMYKNIIQSDVHNEIQYNTLKNDFKVYRDMLRRNIKEAKQSYYRRTFTTYKKEIKKTWSLIKDTLQRKENANISDEFKLENRTITNFEDIANEFNRYFINIGYSLSETIRSQQHFSDYLNNKTKARFDFVQVNEDEISKTIDKLKNKASYGCDNISNKLIKCASGILTKPITLLTNQILKTGIYPTQLKLSRVKPLFKKGDSTQFCNYRPISILPSISKVFEHIISAQIMNYLLNNNLLSEQQFGFRPCHSTELASIKILNNIITEMDE